MLNNAVSTRTQWELASAPRWLTFCCRDGSQWGGRGSLQPWRPMRPHLGQAYGWGNIPPAGDWCHALAIWLCICFGCIFSRTWLRTSPETQTFLSIGRWRGYNPRNPSWFLPRLTGGWLRCAVLFGGVRRQRLDAPHGCAVCTAAVRVAWAEGERPAGPCWAQHHPNPASHRLICASSPTKRWRGFKIHVWLHFPLLLKEVVYVPCPCVIRLLLEAWVGWLKTKSAAETGLTRELRFPEDITGYQWKGGY